MCTSSALPIPPREHQEPEAEQRSTRGLGREDDREGLAWEESRVRREVVLRRDRDRPGDPELVRAEREVRRIKGITGAAEELKPSKCRGFDGARKRPEHTARGGAVRTAGLGEHAAGGLEHQAKRLAPEPRERGDGAGLLAVER